MTRRRMRKRHRSAAPHSAVAQGAVTVQAHDRKGLPPGRWNATASPGAGQAVSAKAPLDLAAAGGVWSVTYAPSSATAQLAATAPVAAPPAGHGAPAGLEAPPAGLPRAAGLDDHVEAVALAMWNEGRQAEAVAFLERQVALAKGEPAAEAPPPAAPASEPRACPAILPTAASKEMPPPSTRWLSARTIAMGITAAVLLALGADFLIGPEDEAGEPVQLLAASEGQQPVEPAPGEAAADFVPPDSPLSKIPPLADLDGGGTPASAATPDPAVAARAAQPAAAQTGSAEDAARPASEPAAARDAADNDPGQAAASTSPATPEAGAERAQMPSISVASVDAAAGDPAGQPVVMEGSPPPEVIYEDFSDHFAADPAGEASVDTDLPAEAAPPIPAVRMPKPRPAAAVAIAPAGPEPQAGEPEIKAPVLMGRPRGTISERLAERRAAAEDYAARRRAVAEQNAARRGRVLLGRPYPP